MDQGQMAQVLEAIAASENRLLEEVSSLREALYKHARQQLIASASSEQLPGGAGSFKSEVGRIQSSTTASSPNHNAPQLSCESPLPLLQQRAAQASPKGVSALESLPSPGLAVVEAASLDMSNARAEMSMRHVATISSTIAKYWHSWPGSIPLLGSYAVQDDDKDDSLQTLAVSARRLSAQTVSASAGNALQGFFDAGKKKGRPGMIHPDGMCRLVFDAMSLMVLTFDVVYTPYFLTWEDAVPHGVSLGIMLSSTCFWSIGLCLSFITGIYTEMGLELRFKRVAAHYLRTWFFPDFLCILADVLNLLPILITGSSSKGSSMKLVRFVRIIKLARFLRVLGVLRMLRVLRAFTEYMEAALSESWSMVVRIFQVSACLLWLCHLVACIWYAIGMADPKDQGDVKETWVDTPVGLEGQYVFKDLSPWYQYVLSFQWGLAQLTLGAHDVGPINSTERLFTVACNLFALIFGGTLVSILSTTLIDLKEINQERTTRIRTLKEFLLQHQVETKVRLHVLHQVHDRVRQGDSALVEKDVDALDLLSHALQRDLRYSLFARHICTHSLFCAWGCVDPEILKHLCGEGGLEFICFLAEDEIFKEAEAATAGYHCISGRIEYTLEAESILQGANASHAVQLAESLPSSTMMVDEGAWLCEAAWWLVWYHVGTATSKGHSTLLSLPPQAIESATSTNLTVRAITCEYANLFHHSATKAWEQCGKIPTDVEVHGCQLSDVIFSMSADIHIILGMASLQQAVSQPLVLPFSAPFGRLQQEIREGSAIVLLDKKGLLQRQVSLIVLRVEHKSKVLVELAEYEQAAQKWRARCRLPGTKQRFGEMQEQALERLLSAHLDCFRDAGGDFLVEAETCMRSQEVSTAASADYGIGTTYKKNIFTATLEAQDVSGLSRFSHSTSGAAAAVAAGVGPSVAAGGSPARLQELLERLGDTVFVFGGKEHLGIYAWLDDPTVSELTSQQELLSTWVEVIATHSLPEDLAQYMASNAREYGVSSEWLTLV